MTKAELKENLINSLISQGFAVNGHIAPSSLDKQHYKVIQEHSRKEQIELQKDFLLENFEIVKKYFINSKDINPKEIKLELRNVDDNSKLQAIYRWWNLIWWSVPYQRAYGRQMRFILWDVMHKPIKLTMLFRGKVTRSFIGKTTEVYYS